MRSDKSTNGRTEKKTSSAMGAVRWAARALEAVSPALAARWASWLFFKTSRHVASEAERAVLETAERSWVPFEGGRLAVWRWGRGPRVLLVHGWSGRGGQLHALVAPLVASGHRVIAFDGPGHGASSGRSASLPELGRAVAAVAASEGPLRAVVTHSLGGPAVALAVAGGLSVERLVMVSPPADAQTWLFKLADALGLSPSTRAGLRARVEARAGVAIERLHAAALARSLRMPLLVVHDRDDREVAWADGAAVASLAGGALLTTHGLGHQRILKSPDVVEAVAQFVGQAPRRTSTLELELYDRPARWAQVAALGSRA